MLRPRQERLPPTGWAPVHRVADMAAAVGQAAWLARPGWTVLLAPACSSLDMYRDYAARGTAFSDAVHALDDSGSDA